MQKILLYIVYKNQKNSSFEIMTTMRKSKIEEKKVQILAENLDQISKGQAKVRMVYINTLEVVL